MSRWQTQSLRERFDAKWIPEPNTGCWLWMGGLAGRGYPMVYVPGQKWGTKAHRVAWELYRGPIPDGLVIDHTCRVKSCVNPDHLRPVTSAVNVTENSISLAALNKVKTHCPRGHEYTTENTLRMKRNDGRVCRTCKRMLEMVNHAKRRIRKHAITGVSDHPKDLFPEGR